MESLDGNAIAGHLFAVFGEEMTTARTACAGCGTRSFVGELHVYLGGPGTVACCSSCGNTLLILTEIRGIACVGMPGLADLDSA